MTSARKNCANNSPKSLSSVRPKRSIIHISIRSRRWRARSPSLRRNGRSSPKKSSSKPKPPAPAKSSSLPLEPRSTRSPSRRILIPTLSQPPSARRLISTIARRSPTPRRRNALAKKKPNTTGWSPRVKLRTGNQSQPTFFLMTFWSATSPKPLTIWSISMAKPLSIRVLMRWPSQEKSCLISRNGRV